MAVLIFGCSNDVDPRVIPGGGIGDGEIDGELNVYIVDADDVGIAGAEVEVGAKKGTTDSKGLVTFSEIEGKQTIAVKATGFRSTVWVGANGANVTIPLDVSSTTPDSATLSGTIANWSAVTVPQGHFRAAAVLYSQSDRLGDAENNLETPNSMNFCGVTGTTCDFSVVTRTGTISLVAMIVDGDPNGTPANPNDDILTVIGWAYKTGITVEKGVNQSGIMLTQVEAGNLQNVTIDYGTPPAALADKAAIVGIDVSDDEVVQMPLFVTDKTKLLAPKPTVFAADATYRLTAIAQTTAMDAGAQSILLRRNLDTTALAAGEWLVPPTGVTATRTQVKFEKVTNAKVYTVEFRDANKKRLLDISSFDGTLTVDVPALVALPTSGTITARVQAIGADINVNDFSLEQDRAALWGVAAEPVTIN